MPALPYKHALSIVLSILLIFTLFITSWRMPPVGMALGLIFLLFGLIATSYTVLRKNRKAYQQGKITLSVSIRNIIVEISTILLTMALAGLAGRHLSTLATGNIDSHPVKLVTGTGIGILVGWAIGLFIKFASGRLIRNSPGRELPVVSKE